MAPRQRSPQVLLEAKSVNLYPLLLGFIFAVGLELTIRCFLYGAYGKHYRNFLFPYFLVDNPEYGFCFRKGASAKQINFLIFDKYIFLPGKKNSLTDLKENKSARVDFNINSQGFRGAEFDPDIKRSRLRIFCSGGSTTACNSVDDHQTWPFLLEKELRGRGYDTEVINAGVQGWFSYHERLRFFREIKSYKPDMVLFHQGWNEEFEYSSLSLGKDWKPERVRNVVEENYLYTQPNRFLSSTRWLSFYLGFYWYRRNCVNLPSMSFANPNRWNVLKSTDYLTAWFDNLAAIEKGATEQGVPVLMLDYPCLVNTDDTAEDREVYLRNSRLSHFFADYQAISKKRISWFLKKIAPMIPSVDGSEIFKDFHGTSRVRFFLDEIHLSAEGNEVFARAVADKLVQSPQFQQRYKTGYSVGARADLVSLRREINAGSRYLNDKVDQAIDQLQKIRGGSLGASGEVPANRYTTF